ncbi:MAG: SDR family oxidoreductase, partial [Planctomycetota bacterium]
FDVTDRAACRSAAEGCDAIVHLAGHVDPVADFHEHLLGPNLIGVYNVLEAAAEAGVGRLVYASSAQTIEAYPKDVQPDVTHPVRPDNLYGVCKVFGEALACHLAYKRGMSAVCIRIANFREKLEPTTKLNMRDMTAYISPDDMSELIARSIEVEGITFEIVNGVSGNRYKRMRMDETCALLGMELKDDAFRVLGYPEPAAKSDPAW